MPLNTIIGNTIKAAANTPATNIEGFATTLVSSAVGGIPIVGGLASGLVNLVGGALGGNPRVPYGAERSAAAPHRPASRNTAASPALDMADFAEDDGTDFAGWARQGGVYVEDIKGALLTDMNNSKNNWSNIMGYWRAHPEGLRGALTEWFQRHPDLIPSAASIEPMSTASLQTGSTATQPIVRQPSGTATPNNTVSDDKTTTYALIGGGVLVAIVLLIMLLK